MTAPVIQLHVHRNTKLKRERREVYDRLRGAIKEVDKNIDGFAIVAYRKDDDGIQYTTYYSVRDAMDRYGLPDAAHSMIRRAIDEN